MSAEIKDSELLEMADDWCTANDYVALEQLDEEDREESLQMQLVPLLRHVAELQRHRKEKTNG